MTIKYRDYSYTARRKHRNNLFFISFLILFIFFTYVFLTSYVVKTFKFQSDTMEPEIYSRDRILVSPIYNVEKSVKRGDLVVTSPAYNIKLGFLKKSLNAVSGFFTFQLFRPFDLQKRSASKYTIRRVVGLPGDTVYMENFVLYVKTKAAQHFLTEFELTEKEYNLQIKELPENWDKTLPFSGTYPPTVLKDGEYFLLCDNRIASDDSRLWGPVKGKERIYGRILLKFWPFNKFKIYK